MPQNPLARAAAVGLEIGSTLGLVLVLVIVCLQVFFRYIVNLAVPWTEEAARYVCVWMIFLGCAAAVAYESHLRVTWFLDRLSGRAKPLAGIAICLVMLLFDTVVLMGSIELVELNWNQQATTFPVPVGILYVALAIFAAFSFGFLVLQIFANARRALMDRG